MKLRDKLYFSFSILTPGFPHFYYMLGANLGLLFVRRSFRDAELSQIFEVIQSDVLLYSQVH